MQLLTYEPTKNLNLQIVKNPFIVEPDKVMLVNCGSWDTLLDLRNRYFPRDVKCVVVRNNEIIPEDRLSLCYPVPGDHIIISPEIFGGGDDGGKGILGTVLQIALIVVGAATGQYWLSGIAKGLGISAAMAGAIVGSLVGGLLVNTLLPPPKPKLPTMDRLDFDVSRSYSWNPQPTQQAGIPIQRVYGTHKIESPNIIATYIENVNDKQYINILFDLGIGPYKRLYDFKINDQPIENFQGVTIETRLGHLNQTAITNFNDTKTEYPLSVKIVKDTPYTYITEGNAFNGLEVDVTFPQGLYYANDSGGLDSYSVDLRIEIRKQGETNWTPITTKVVSVLQSNGGYWSAGRWEYDEWGSAYWNERQKGDSNPYSHYEGEFYDGWWRWMWIGPPSYFVSQTVDYVTISGAQTSAIRRTFKVDNLPEGRYEIRVSNLTADQTSSRYGDDMYFTAVREVYYDDFEYPRQVLVAVKALATDQLSGSIRFSCMAEGAMVRIYDGQTWKVDVTDNPAWIAFDALTKPVFDNNLNVVKYRGFDPSRLILNEWFEAAQYFDELVPDGKGGQEKRCTFNGVFDSSISTWAAVLQILQVGRSSPVWNGINIGIVTDKKIGTSDLDGITQVFGMGNIVKDSFKESWSSSAERASILTADFMDAEDEYKRKTYTRVNRNIKGNNSIRLPLFGATKSSQVWRELEFRLQKNEKLTNTVTIDAGIEAIRCTIGDKVGISHNVPQWGFSGRIVDATESTVTIDREVTIESGKSYVILVQNEKDEELIKTVSNAPGTYSVLQLSTPFTNIPAKYSNYSFGESTKYIKPFKVIKIDPHQDYRKRTLTCIEYNGSIYDVDLQQPAIPTPNYSSLDVLPSVTDIRLDELLIKGKDGSVVDVIDVYFTKPSNPFYEHAEIWYNKGGGWVYSGISLTGYYRIENVEINKTYQIAVVTVNTLGQKQLIQNAPKASIYTLGKLDPPSAVTNFTAKQNGQFIDFNWSHIPDADLWGYEIRMGINWESARTIATAISQNHYTWQAELNGTYRFLIKAMDESGLYSTATSSVDITLRGINENLNIILSQDEMTKASPADGTKTNFIYINDYHALMIPHTITDTDVPTWTDTTPEITNYTGNINLNAEYITNVIDTYKDTDTWIRIQEAIDAIDTDATDQSYPNRTDLTYPQDTDTHVAMPVDYSIWYQVSDDNITYTAWKQYTGTVQENFRYIKIKFSVNIASQTGRFKLLNFLLSFDVPDVYKTITDLAIAATTGTDITFSNYGLTLYTSPVVKPFIKNATGSRAPSVSNITTTGCHIDIFDAANAKVAGIVDLEIQGY